MRAGPRWRSERCHEGDDRVPAESARRHPDTGVGRGVAVTAAAVTLVLAGCGDGGDAQARQAATDFLSTMRAGDFAGACALLAPATVDSLEHRLSASCPVALEQAPLPAGQVVDAAIWGDNAQVHTDDDTVFLTRSEQGWRVAAAGCSARGEAPYVCVVSGP